MLRVFSWASHSGLYAFDICFRSPLWSHVGCTNVVVETRFSEECFASSEERFVFSERVLVSFCVL